MGLQRAGGPDGEFPIFDATGAILLHGRLDIPTPSEPEPGQRLIPVAPLVAAKLALRTALREEGMTNVALAGRLGVTEGAVRRLVDPDHASRLDRVVIALAAIGRGLVVEDLRNP